MDHASASPQEPEFRSEDALVNAFVSALSKDDGTTLPSAAIVREFAFERGRTDVVAISLDGEVVAFEAKLTKWRDAMFQAYRNTCFAHRSFVVLPWDTAARASRFTAEFQRRGVGICAVLGGRIVVVQDATRVEPVEPWLSVRASEVAREASS